VKRGLIVALIVLVAAVAARVAAPAHQRQVRFSAALACGVERWNIKTLKDRPRLLPARATTVAHLTSLPRPSYLPPSRRLPSERRIYSVIAGVTLDRTEADLDHHLVLRSGSRTMIAGDSLAALHQWCDRYPAEANDRGTQRRAGLHQGPHSRRCLLRLPARADGCRSKRDRAASRSWLRLPVEGGATSVSAASPASLGREVRRVVSR
jgi:hypothetical protein